MNEKTGDEGAVKFHLSLNVADLGRAVAFYRTLFDREPAKRHDDYAKFEMDDPPVVFSLAPHAPGPGGSLSHVREHYVTHAFDGAIPHESVSVDEVRLTGTFNAGLEETERACVVAESLRVLKQGGKVVVHRLMADRPLPGAPPRVPGLAAMVSRVGGVRGVGQAFQPEVLVSEESGWKA
jgi:catechol 2,3-dioxygenase-like lactoylglutathione lyase family enzyme